MLAERMHDALASHTGAVIGTQVSSLTHSIAASSIATAAAHTVAVAIAHYIPVLVAKLLASAAFKKSLAAAVAKLLMMLTTTLVAKAVAATLGTVSASTVMWILAPIILGVLARQIYVFPRKLGGEVSAALRRELGAKFGATNRDILQGIYKDLTSGTKLAEALVGDKDVQKMVLELIDTC